MRTSKPPPGRRQEVVSSPESHCASILLYISAFQLRGSVVEESGPHPSRGAYLGGMRSETVHRAEAPPIRACVSGAAGRTLAPRVHRPPSRGGARPLPRGPGCRDSAWARGRRQLVEAGARPSDPPPSGPRTPLPRRGEPRELREAVPPVERGGARGRPLDPRAAGAVGRDPGEVRMGA